MLPVAIRIFSDLHRRLASSPDQLHAPRLPPRMALVTMLLKNARRVAEVLPIPQPGQSRFVAVRERRYSGHY